MPLDTTPELVFAFEVQVQVGPPAIFPSHRSVPILGGTFEGPELRGRVLAGGVDRQVVRPDGTMDLHARYTLETDRSELISVVNRGIRRAPPEVMERLRAGLSVDPALVYCRTTPVFTTQAPELQWLTQSVFIGSADRYPDAVVVRFWRAM
jgi:hypothetical protein